MDRIRLVASDMDATLLDENSQLPPDFEAAVKALAEKGIRFAAASGRPLYTLEEMFPNLRKEMILIGDNGGAIRWPEKTFILRKCRRRAGALWHGRPGKSAMWPSSAV